MRDISPTAWDMGQVAGKILFYVFIAGIIIAIIKAVIRDKKK